VRVSERAPCWVKQGQNGSGVRAPALADLDTRKDCPLKTHVVAHAELKATASRPHHRRHSCFCFSALRS